MDFIFSSRFLFGFAAGIVACYALHRWVMPLPGGAASNGA